VTVEGNAGVLLIVLPLAFNGFLAFPRSRTRPHLRRSRVDRGDTRSDQSRLRVIIGLFLIIGSLEFVGHFEKQGWKPAGVLVPITYIAWSLWLILSGLTLLIG
jgi:hypothetical protein